MCKKLTFSFYLVFILSIFLLPSVSSAMTITPVRYEISGDPGQTLTNEMTLVNDDDVPVTYYSSFANFEAQGESGSAAFIDRPTEGIGTWMETERSVIVYPGEQKTVTFSVSIPENAEPGGHFGVIFWGTSPEDEDGKQLAVSAKTGLIVLLSVSGDVQEGGGLLEFDTKDGKFWYNTLPVNMFYRFRNDGGDRIKPNGKIKIRNILFIPVDRFNANPVDGNILPDSTRKFNVDWVKYSWPKDKEFKNGVIGSFFEQSIYQWRNYAFGLYSAKLDLVYGLQEQKVNEVVYFFVFPWQLLICLLIIIFIIYFGGKKLLKKYNNYIIKQAQSAMKPQGVDEHA